MHLVDSGQFKSNLSQKPSHVDDLILFGSLGIMVMFAGLICLNFRTRLLNRTTWKEKQQQQQQQKQQKQEREPNQRQSVTRPLPTPTDSEYSEVYENCSYREDSELETNCQRSSRCKHCQAIPQQSTTNFFRNRLNMHGYTHQTNSNQGVMGNGFHYGTIPADQVKQANQTCPIKADPIRTHRTFQLPNWALKLFHYLTESRSSSSKSRSRLPNGLSEAHGFTKDSGINESISGCSTGSSAGSHLSTGVSTATKRANGYCRYLGSLPPWRRDPRQVEPALPSKIVQEMLPFSKENTNVMPLSTDVSSSRGYLNATQAIDTSSLISEKDIIDPVYSKIRGSSFSVLVPCDYDSVLGSAEWSAPPNFQEGSILSLSSEDSDHASAHIYHQLIKRSPKRVPPHLRQSQLTTEQIDSPIAGPRLTGNPSITSTTGSTWSIRLPRHSPLRRVIDCVIAPRSTESFARLCPYTSPPQLPDRSYGQSTVNLVYRLRSLLRYKQSEQQPVSSTPSPRPQSTQKAATLTFIPVDSSYDKLHTAVTQSCTNVTGDQVAANGLLRQPPRRVSENAANETRFFQQRFHNSEHSRAQWRKPMTLNDHFFQNSKIGSNECSTPQSHACTYNAVQPDINSSPDPRVSLQRSLNGSQIHLRWSDLTGSYGNIRHIDSEVDLMDNKLTTTENTSSKSTSKQLVPANLPTDDSVIPPTTPSDNNSIWRDVYALPETCLPRAIASSSPAKSLIASAQTRTLMSPLMERSMEDDEVRYALNQPSHLFCPH